MMFFDPWVIVRGNAARPGEAKDAAGPADAPPAAPSPARRAIFDGLPRRRRRTYTAEAAFFLATPADRSWGDGELLDLVCRQINPANWDETSATFGATRVCCVERGQPDDGRWEGALRETVSFPVFPADSRLGRLGLGPLVELRTVLRVRMSRSRFQARVEYRIGAECLASRAADRCSPGEFGNGVLDIDEGELIATELGGGVKVVARKTIRFAASDPASALPGTIVEWLMGQWMQVEIGKIEHQTASALENLLSAVGAAAAV